jgi:nicotinamidase-related amidase
VITEIDINTALILIDLQKSNLKIETVPPVSEVLKQAAKLVTAFREVGLPIVVVNVNPVGAAWTKVRVEKPTIPRGQVTQALAKIVMPLAGKTDILPEIITQPDDIFITKKTWNAFYSTPLQDELRKRKVTGIVLAGVSTSIGVEGTARAASELGYNIAFAVDAMTDRVPEAHRNSLRFIFPRIGESGTTEEIINKLTACR